jgi:hypothetical protein
MKNIIIPTLFTALFSLSLGTQAMAQNTAIACVTDSRPVDGPFSGLLFEIVEDGIANIKIVNASRSLGGKTKAETLRLDSAVCNGQLVTLESYPVQYEWSLSCEDKERKNKIRSTRFLLETNSEGFLIEEQQVSAMGTIISKRKIQAPKGSSCVKINDNEILKLKEKFEKIQEEADAASIPAPHYPRTEATELEHFSSAQ